MIKDQAEQQNIEDSLRFRAKYSLLLLMVKEVIGLELGFGKLVNLTSVKQYSRQSEHS